jgi:hypothetical protein
VVGFPITDEAIRGAEFTYIHTSLPDNNFLDRRVHRRGKFAFASAKKAYFHVTSETTT